MRRLTGITLALSFLPIFAVLPATTNYKLNSYGFGSGGAANSTTSNYALEGISGEQGGQTSLTATYKIKPGFVEAQQANLPKLATFDNPSSYYDKLHFAIDQQNNPSDAKYALSISTDNFVSNIRYVKSDLTVGSTLSLADYQTYTSWGGATGSIIIGLLPSTTYYLRVKATQGKFTESAFGPISSAATSSPQLTFGITTDTQPTPPFSIAFGNLLPTTLTSSPQHINISLATNADSGGNVYLYSKNAGLKSLAASYTVASATADLGSVNEGFGAQSTSISQTSGGPFTIQTPYNGVAGNVGIIDTQVRPIYSTAGPLVGGSASLLLETKVSATAPSATDYTDILTMLAAACY